MWDTLGYTNGCRKLKLSQLIKEQQHLKNYPGYLLVGSIIPEKLSIINKIIEEKFNETITI